MGEAMTLEEALAFVRELSPVDEARLIERKVPDIERELRAAWSAPDQHLFLRSVLYYLSMM